ncbi:hypothetical protein CHS0354_007422 [Potamilus streckersoni]|uniref:Uncharacterized protein n=1 Tax=Potamilus streckersoni TaxID=2493646 RepID=A0AAE0SW26_9BIVA|nr:hypothetical protein CHS0354_007422 [Potamilus streckersoni]
MNGYAVKLDTDAYIYEYDPTVAILVPVVLVLFTASTIVVVFLLRRKRMVYGKKKHVKFSKLRKS